ncbi:MAG: type II secretion system F family protein [Oscillospiraceae bacterium]
MNFIFILLATAISAMWLFVFMASKQTSVLKITLEKININNEEIEKKKRKIIDTRKKLEACDKLEEFTINLTTPEKSQLKELKQLMKKGESLKLGKLELLDLFPAMGYGVLEMFKIDATTNFMKNIVELNTSITGKATALDKSKYQISSAISYAVFGVSVSFALAALIGAMGKQQESMLIGVLGIAISIVLSYLPLDGLKEKSNNRQNEIISDFPQAVSKLTLLVGSGIDVAKAWQQTSESGMGYLYQEMRLTMSEMNNGINAYDAYNNFIHRCNNKYTSKLATSIMQNLKKGNDEICALLGDIASESWSDRRHHARRAGEVAQSKLLLPIMMMFGGIILLVIAPAMSSFGGMGM